MAEATITRKVAKHLKAMKLSGEPVEWVKIHGSGMQRAGEPDYSITYHGRSIKAELKDKGKSPTKLQKYRMDQWLKAGAVVGVVREIEDLELLLSEARINNS